MKSIIIDDDAVVRELLAQYIEETPELKLGGQFSTVKEALHFLTKEKVDLIFLDVEMPEMNGIDFLEEFKPDAEIVLISSNDKYAVNGFNLEVSDYLLKPISFARFNRCITRLSQKNLGNETAKHDFLFIKDKGVYQKILIPEIQYIQSSSEYVTIHTKVKRIMLYSSMDNMLSKLPSNFKRVHRSYIVNVDAIEKVNGNSLEVNKQLISVSKTYHEDIMNELGIKMKMNHEVL
ncbi:MAG: LytR/AlgR family response regulator transcription factor [Flavobacteriia bacterium]|jgi:two-component system LytT family response regulator